MDTPILPGRRSHWKFIPRWHYGDGWVWPWRCQLGSVDGLSYKGLAMGTEKLRQWACSKCCAPDAVV